MGDKEEKGKRRERKERHVGEKEEIVAPMSHLRKLETVLLETRRFIRTERRLLKKLGRILPSVQFYRREMFYAELSGSVKIGV